MEHVLPDGLGQANHADGTSTILRDGDMGVVTGKPFVGFVGRREIEIESGNENGKENEIVGSSEHSLCEYVNHAAGCESESETSRVCRPTEALYLHYPAISPRLDCPILNPCHEVA
jgi:hypothetical protein